MKQEQFLNVLDRDEAEKRFRAALDLRPLASEDVKLGQALGRVLADDIVAPVDVPNFDRANVDGYAVRAEDTFNSSEDRPRTLTWTGESLAPGVLPRQTVTEGFACAIATGAMMPRGADSVVMVEHTDADKDTVAIRRPVTPGANVSFAGTDIGRGETILRHGDLLTSRETGVLAALGIETLRAVRRPRVAVISTGNELIAPGEPLRPGLVFDSNMSILADAVREQGGEPIGYGIVPDVEETLDRTIRQALTCDVVLLSGGTSKGEGDISYRVVSRLGPPGIVAHGVALKPGKPLCLAATHAPPNAARPDGEHRIVPVVILPGFPTSAIFTFHEFVAPVIRALAGRTEDARATVAARMPMRINSERGRTEYLLVGLVEGISPGEPYLAFPMGKGSGSVTAFSRADGFVVIPRQQEYLEQGSLAQVHLLGRDLRPADLVVIGSHCVGLDFLLGQLRDQGYRSKFLAVGSTAGLESARRGECDLAGIHLLDPSTGEYNRSFIGPDLVLVAGYRRSQGIVFRQGDSRFEKPALADCLKAALADPECVMVNRNRGSGTRILIDGLLGAARPAGYSVEAKSHNAVVAGVAQGRADWGVAIETVARQAGLGFLASREEHFDFVYPRTRGDRPAVRAFCELLGRDTTTTALARMGFHTG